MHDNQIKLRYYVQFYLTTLIIILVLKSKDAGIITTFFCCRWYICSTKLCYFVRVM